MRLRTRRLFDDPMEQCLEDGRINPELFLVKIDDPSRVPISDSLQRLLDQRVVYLKNPPRPANDLKDMLDFDLEAAKHGSLKFIPGLVQQNPSVKRETKKNI